MVDPPETESFEDRVLLLLQYFPPPSDSCLANFLKHDVYIILVEYISIYNMYIFLSTSYCILAYNCDAPSIRGKLKLVGLSRRIPSGSSFLLEA